MYRIECKAHGFSNGDDSHDESESHFDSIPEELTPRNGDDLQCLEGEFFNLTLNRSRGTSHLSYDTSILDVANSFRVLECKTSSLERLDKQFHVSGVEPIRAHRRGRAPQRNANPWTAPLPPLRDKELKGFQDSQKDQSASKQSGCVSRRSKVREVVEARARRLDSPRPSRHFVAAPPPRSAKRYVEQRSNPIIKRPATARNVPKLMERINSLIEKKQPSDAARTSFNPEAGAEFRNDARPGGRFFF